MSSADLINMIYGLIAAAVLSVCGICALNSGIGRRKHKPVSNALTVILILCGIAEAAAPYIRKDTVSGDYFYVITAFSYAAVILLYTAIYRLSYKKHTENMIKLTFGFSVIVMIIQTVSAFMMLVAAGFGLLLIIPKY